MHILMAIDVLGQHVKHYLIGVIGASSAFLGKYLASITANDTLQLISLSLGCLIAIITLIKLVVDWVIPTLKGKKNENKR